MVNKTPRLERVTFLFRVISKFVNQITDINFIKQSTNLPLSRRQFEILKILFISGSFSVSELAKFLMISRPAASKSVHNLVKHGLVERNIPNSDRRMILVSILPRGERIMEKYFEMLRHQETVILNHFNDEELEELEKILYRYITILMNEYQHEAELICLHCNTKFSEECPLVEKGRASCYHTIVKATAEVL